MLPRGETDLIRFELGPPGSPLANYSACRLLTGLPFLTRFQKLSLSPPPRLPLSLGDSVNISTCPQMKPPAGCADSYSTKTAF